MCRTTNSPRFRWQGPIAKPRIRITGAFGVGMLLQQSHKDRRRFWALHVSKRADQVTVVRVAANTILKNRYCPHVSSLGYGLHGIIAHCNRKNIEEIIHIASFGKNLGGLLALPAGRSLHDFKERSATRRFSRIELPQICFSVKCGGSSRK